MTIQVDKSGEVHPVLWDDVQYDLVSVDDGDKAVVTHHAPFACSTSSPVETTSSLRATTSSGGCSCSDPMSDFNDSCYGQWLVCHFPAVGTGNQG